MEDTRKVIVVIGATGNQGGSVLSHLLSDRAKNIFKVRAVTRKPTDSAEAQHLTDLGAEVVQCNIDDYEQSKNAFKGSYGVFAMTNYWSSDLKDKQLEIAQGKNMALAARDVGVQHFIFAGLPDTEQITGGTLHLPHYMTKVEIEKCIRNECYPAIPFVTFVYVGFYFSNFSTWFTPQHNSDGSVVFHQPIRSTATLPTYDVRDTGAVVLRCFENPHTLGQLNVVPLVSENLSVNQICQIIAEETGRKASHEPMSWEEFEVGKNQESISNMKFYDEFGDKEASRNEHETRKVYREMNTLRNWIRETKWLSQ